MVTTICLTRKEDVFHDLGYIPWATEDDMQLSMDK